MPLDPTDLVVTIDSTTRELTDTAKVTGTNLSGVFASDTSMAAGATTDELVTPAGVKTATGYRIALTAASLQATINEVLAAGGGEVRLSPASTYALAARHTVPAGVKVRGSGGTTVTSTNANGAFEIIGDDASVEDLKIDLTGSASTAIGVLVNKTGSPAARCGVRRCRITGSGNNACRVLAFEDFEFSGNVVSGCANGFSALSTTTGSGLRVIGNTFRDVGVVNIQVYGTSHIYDDVLIADNVLTNFRTPATAIPIEVTGTWGAVISGNVIETVATRGVSTGGCNDLILANNTIKNQTAYAFEIGNGSRVSVIGNVTQNCKTFFSTTNGPLTDLNVTGNTYSGSGASSTQVNTWVFGLHNQSVTRARIANNLIFDWQYLTGAIRLGSGAFTASDVTIEGNSFYCIDANTPILVLNANTAARTIVRANVVRIQRNLVAADDFITVLNATNTTTPGTQFADNLIEFTGTVAAATAATGLGLRNTGAGAQAGLVIERNTVLNGSIGVYSNTTSTDARIVDNNTRTCVAADTVPATALRRTKLEYEMSAAPTTGTWRVGDRVWNDAPTAGGIPGWVCVTAGTPGTWRAMAVLAA